jgi:TRAP-type C4-dicarboxylate transport system permease small subunit
MLLTIVSGQTWGKLNDADKKAFEAIFKEAAAKATDEIAAAEIKLVDDFATKYKKTVVKSDRAAFAQAFQKFHLGPDATWDKALYEKLQAIKRREAGPFAAGLLFGCAPMWRRARPDCDPAMPTDIDALPKVMGDDGQFHATDEAVDLSHTKLEGWVALGIFWLLGATVFYQFFTRYVLNDSASWTEEIARYLLIGTVFVGAAIGVAKNNHIQVDLLYRYLPQRAARALSIAVDVLRIAFLGAMVVLTAQMMHRLAGMQMTIIDLPMNLLYGTCLFGFVMMTLRSIAVARVHWRRGYSVLERPESAIEDR